MRRGGEGGLRLRVTAYASALADYVYCGKERYILVMAKKKNRGARMFFALALLALLVVLYIVIVPKLSSGEEAATEAETEMLADYKTDNLTALSYTYTGGDETISLSFRYKSSNYTWYLEGDDEFPVDQTTLSEMASAIVSIPMDRRLSSDEITTSEAGLDSPAHIITANYGSTEYTYKIGDYNSFTGTYYFSVSGDDSIYMIASGLQSYFEAGLLDLAQYATIPTLTSSNVVSYDVMDTMSSATYSDSTHIGYLSSLYIYDAIDYKPDDEMLTYYMLGGEATTVTVPYTETLTVQNDDSSIASGAGVSVDHTITFKVGALCDGDDSKRYVMIDDSPLVYKMSDSILSSIINPAAEETAAEETTVEDSVEG